MTLVRRVTRRMAAATLVLGVISGVTTWSASAQTQQRGASSLHAPLKNATPIERMDCKGGNSDNCPPGSHWVCLPYGERCYCTPC